MPRRKKLPVVPNIKGIGNEPETHIVQKSNPLMTLSETDLTLTEFKILDAYLARIDSHEPDKRFIKLEKGAIEKYLGVTQIKSADLEKRIDNLFQTITLRDKNKSKGFTKIALFEKAVCYQDDDGLWQVELGASAAAMEYIFNIENIGYLRYRLKNVINLTSRYSYVLYLYLEQNRHVHLTWEVDLEQLKSMMCCNAVRYEQYKFFNSEVLKKCQKELNEKTECSFTYAPIRSGRRITAIRFTLKPLRPELPIREEPSATSVYEPDDELDEEDALSLERSRRSKEICFGFYAEEFDGFTDEELKLLKDIAWAKKRDEDVERHLNFLNDMALACQHATADYIRQKILLAKNRHPKNLFLYVKKMIENEN